MSSLDQAFIKAYQGHGGHPAEGPAGTARSMPLADAFCEPPPSHDAPQVAIVSLDAVLQTLSAPPRFSPQDRSANPTTQREETGGASVENASLEAFGQARAGNDSRGHARRKAHRPTALLRVWPEQRQPIELGEQPRARRAPQLDDLDLPDVVPLPGLPTAEDQHALPTEKSADRRATGDESSGETLRGRAASSTALPQPASDTTDLPRDRAPAELAAQAKGQAAGACSPAEADCRAAPETAAQLALSKPAPAEPSTSGAALQPLLQVDYFHWPRLCRRLAGIAGEELQRLAAWLEQSTAKGRRVIAFGAYQRGEGATSLLLAAARRLAAQGLRVVLVDADFARPQLAARLGMVPQVGWEAVLAGRAELADALVESIEDRLALLPVREAFAGAGLPLGHEVAVGRSLEQLAAAMDLVLVDVGPLKEPAVVEGLLLRAMGPALDGLLLVENVAAAAKARRAEIEQRLAAAGVPVAGVIENLVRPA